ncbi:hypothetical protein [Sorangium atrum]|uniref:PEP-CTERM protein-sorting domain-containing protein n=1 Tax=Sorangium atrum TaxID=2995308 RepID=A0ABT5C5B7_9BACT|nr:hypothetical protein [Sorangium aterium]MDC0680362.1 hypothetical protein [Sorangium aterium]
MLHPPRDAEIVHPPYPGSAGMTPPMRGVEAITLDSYPEVASIEPPDPHVHALGLALALTVVALRR